MILTAQGGVNFLSCYNLHYSYIPTYFCIYLQLEYMNDCQPYMNMSVLLHILHTSLDVCAGLNILQNCYRGGQCFCLYSVPLGESAAWSCRSLMTG